MIFETILAKLISWVITHGIKMGLILIFGFAILKISERVMMKLLRGFMRKNLPFKKLQNIKLEQKRIKTLEKVLKSILTITIWLIVFVTLLSEVGINITPLLTAIGIGGLALGLGARSLIQDYIAGIFILLEDQYRIEEEVEIGGTRGKVKDFNLRRTVLEDEKGVLHYFSNSQIKKASNFSRK